jgi:PspAA-like protein
MKKEGPSKTTKKGSRDGNWQRVRDLKQNRFKKRTHWRNASTMKKGMYAIVRIMGHGQFRVDDRTAKLINRKDHELLKIIQRHEQGEKDYAKRVAEVVGLVKQSGLPLDHKEIVQSDIIVPGAEFSIDNAKNLFRGQGSLV